MRLGEKLRSLRELEGGLRGLGRAMTQQEVVAAVKKELNKKISQSYLSQIESGARPHMTSTTRMLLARFFKVHPGYLVDDPEGFAPQLISEAWSEKLDLWMVNGAEKFERDPELANALIEIAKHADTRRCLLLLAQIIRMPELMERLSEVLKPGPATAAAQGQPQTAPAQRRTAERRRR